MVQERSEVRIEQLASRSDVGEDTCRVGEGMADALHWNALAYIRGCRKDRPCCNKTQPLPLLSAVSIITRPLLLMEMWSTESDNLEIRIYFKRKYRGRAPPNFTLKQALNRLARPNREISNTNRSTREIATGRTRSPNHVFPRRQLSSWHRDHQGTYAICLPYLQARPPNGAFELSSASTYPPALNTLELQCASLTPAADREYYPEQPEPRQRERDADFRNAHEPSSRSQIHDDSSSRDAGKFRDVLWRQRAQTTPESR
jgi:hypothetical protein